MQCLKMQNYTKLLKNLLDGEGGTGPTEDAIIALADVASAEITDSRRLM